MTLAELKQVIRAMVPSANKAKVSDTFLDTLVNKAVTRVNSDGKVLRTEKYFDVNEGQRTYDLATLLTDYVLIGEGGLWLNKGTEASPNYQQLDAVDRNYLNRWFPGWVNLGNGNPNRYIVETNKIHLDQKASTTLTNGLWLPDYVKKPTPMTDDSHYPFSGSETEYAFLEPLDDVIIAYVRWILKHSVGTDEKGIMTQQEYEIQLRVQMKMVKRRPDYKSNTTNYRWRGR